MIGRLFFCAALGAAFILLAGCAEEAPQPSAPVKMPAKPIKKKVEKPAEVLEPEPSVPVYSYDPAGRRDPFKPLVVIKEPIAREAAPLTPLQKFRLSGFRLIGVIVGKGESKAMVIAPDGKSYIVKKGVKIGDQDGTVTDIKKDEIVVSEKYYDYSGEVRESLQAIGLPEREGVE